MFPLLALLPFMLLFLAPLLAACLAALRQPLRPALSPDLAASSRTGPCARHVEHPARLLHSCWCIPVSRPVKAFTQGLASHSRGDTTSPALHPEARINEFASKSERMVG
jgi:hypothetical protein